MEAVSQTQVVQVATATGMEQRPRSGMEWRQGYYLARVLMVVSVT